jgi:Zn-dependent protease/CBS domain-containing protein
VTRPLRIGRILRVPVEVDLSWLVVFALVAAFIATGVVAEAAPGAPQPVTWALGMLTSLAFFGSLLAHELAHSLVARQQGTAIAGIRLFVFGGVARMAREPRSPRAELAMAAAGPACSLGLAALFASCAVWARLLGLQPLWPALSSWLAMMNLILAGFNLLPGLPLDGGRLLRAAAWRLSGDFLRATRLAVLAGKVTGYGLAAWGVALVIQHQYWGLFNIFVGWFLAHLASSSLQQARLRFALEGVPVSEALSPEAAAVPAGMTIEQLVRERLPSEARTAYLVVQGDQVVGRVSVRDLGGLPRERWPATPVGEIARPLGDDDIVSPDTDAWEALLRLSRSERPHLVVVRDGTLLGVLRRKDLIRLLPPRG